MLSFIYVSFSLTARALRVVVDSSPKVYSPWVPCNFNILQGFVFFVSNATCLDDFGVISFLVTYTSKCRHGGTPRPQSNLELKNITHPCLILCRYPSWYKEGITWKNIQRWIYYCFARHESITPDTLHGSPRGRH
jgi:hypothetical protein